MDNLIELSRDEMRNIKAGYMALDGCYFECCANNDGPDQCGPGTSGPGGGGSCTSNEQCQSDGLAAGIHCSIEGHYLAALCY